MTREEVKKILPIMQAYAEGRAIQIRHPVHKDEWLDCLIEPHFDRPPNYYRIKPEPMEITLVAKDDGTPCESGLHYQKFLGGVHPQARALKFRQVME